MQDVENRFEALGEYLAADPQNGRLARDFAEAGLEANRAAEVWHELAGMVETDTLDREGLNLVGTAAMRCGEQTAAQGIFERLLAELPGDSAVRFNMAWSRALAGEFEAALATLDDATTDSLPQAAMLDLQMRHELRDFDAAEARIDDYVERFPDYGPLQAAASVLAMDLDRLDLARTCAERGGDHPDALATLGMLELGENHGDAASAMFIRSLAAPDRNPRAHLGLGLAALASGDAGAAVAHLDRGAEQFEDHLGSWLAAGWAAALAGDMEGARDRFERAVATDDTFAEGQGSLAAIDAIEGNFDAAKQRMQVALRLDRQSFSAALTSMVLSAARGDEVRARKVFEIASNQPLTPDGSTLAQALVKLGI